MLLWTNPVGEKPLYAYTTYTWFWMYNKVYIWNKVIIWHAVWLISFSRSPGTCGPKANGLLFLLVNPTLVMSVNTNFIFY